MDKEKLEIILISLENITLSEWKKLKDCVDREFEFKSSKLPLGKSNELEKDFEFELIQ